MAPSAWLRGETPRVSPLRGPRILLGRVGWFRGAIHGARSLWLHRQTPGVSRFAGLSVRGA